MQTIDRFENFVPYHGRQVPYIVPVTAELRQELTNDLFREPNFFAAAGALAAAMRQQLGLLLQNAGVPNAADLLAAAGAQDAQEQPVDNIDEDVLALGPQPGGPPVQEVTIEYRTKTGKLIRVVQASVPTKVPGRVNTRGGNSEAMGVEAALATHENAGHKYRLNLNRGNFPGLFRWLDRCFLGCETLPSIAKLWAPVMQFNNVLLGDNAAEDSKINKNILDIWKGWKWFATRDEFLAARNKVTRLVASRLTPPVDAKERKHVEKVAAYLQPHYVDLTTDLSGRDEEVFREWFCEAHKEISLPTTADGGILGWGITREALWMATAYFVWQNGGRLPTHGDFEDVSHKSRFQRRRLRLKAAKRGGETGGPRSRSRPVVTELALETVTPPWARVWAQHMERKTKRDPEDNGRKDPYPPCPPGADLTGYTYLLLKRGARKPNGRPYAATELVPDSWSEQYRLLRDQWFVNERRPAPNNSESCSTGTAKGWLTRKQYELLTSGNLRISQLIELVEDDWEPHAMLSYAGLETTLYMPTYDSLRFSNISPAEQRELRPILDAGADVIQSWLAPWSDIVAHNAYLDTAVGCA